MKKIIIVEDDPMISEIYQKKFADSGFDVLAADSGEKVLDLAKKEKIDVILLDLIMPHMDGFEVLKNLRGGGYDAEIKIIVFSNLSQKEDRDKAIQLGANGFVIKADYSPSELVAEVKRLINQFSEQKRNEVRINESFGEKNGMTTSEKNGKNILIMEDEEVFFEMFGGKLEQEGYSVESARNGAWGLKEALKGNFNLFIIDMAMPVMNGDEIIEKLKLEDKTKNTPIIVLSASSKDEAVKRAEKLGISAFFVKTQITPTELFKKVEEILNN